MSQPPPGRGRARPPGSPSPLHYRPPSPWAPSPPPLISGPRHSTAIVSPPPVQPSPKPFRPLHSPHSFRPHSPSPSFSISPYPMSPTMGQSPEYYYQSPYEPVREYDYAGVPLEPPPPPRPMIYEEDEERGPSTAEIIANQSQEGYVDEKLAEYQATIQLLQDNLSKAREKAKQAEIDSEVGSDYSHSDNIRRRKKTRRIYDSDTDTSEKSDDAIRYPSPPSTRSISATNLTPLKTSTSATNPAQSPIKSTSSTNSTPLLIRPTSSTREFSENAEVVQVEEESFTLGSLDLTVTPFLKESNSHTLDVIAKHLASISLEIKELQVKQDEILLRLRSDRSAGNLGLPDELKLPCDDSKDLEDLETWLTSSPQVTPHTSSFSVRAAGSIEL